MSNRQYDFPSADVSAQECRTMADVRQEIDRLDQILVTVMAERTRYIEAAGRIKASRDDVRLEWRIEDVVSKILAGADENSLPKSIAEPVWRELIDRSIEHEFDVWHSNDRAAT